MHKYNQINQELYVLISKKNNYKLQLKIKVQKSRNWSRLRYLISKYVIFTRLYLLNLLIKTSFLFNQTIIKVDIHIKLIE
jgi:hypothetical protein